MRSKNIVKGWGLVLATALVLPGLTAVGVSSASPLDTNKTDAGRAKNRRVEIVEQ